MKINWGKIGDVVEVTTVIGFSSLGIAWAASAAYDIIIDNSPSLISVPEKSAPEQSRLLIGGFIID